ncbi:hypothetical protein [Longimycelium tulufanense]|uniref:hypothetical protein n=1 Tax=Longimycelium tulufanense TaxID=907463 RepID=UPI00166BDEFE|nr:hypothetical protein [Longimycelium tulufanense]
MRCEVDRQNDRATLLFGSQEDYVLSLESTSLAEVLSLGQRALNELESEPAPC